MTEQDNNTNSPEEIAAQVNADVSPELEFLLGNPYVKSIHGNRIFYTDDFYIDMYKKIHDSKMTSVDAYTALGFDVERLGKTRAEQAGKNALVKARNGDLFTSGQFKFDGSVPPEDLPPELSNEELLAYYMARSKYLEKMLEIQKKIPLILAESSTY